MKQNYEHESSFLGTRARACEEPHSTRRPVQVEVSEIDMQPWQKREIYEKRISFKDCESRYFEAKILLGDEFSPNQLMLQDLKDEEFYFYNLEEYETTVYLGGVEIETPEFYDRDFDPGNE